MNKARQLLKNLILDHSGIFIQSVEKFKIQPSSTDILLEFADFISNIFYRAYIKDDEKFFENLKFKMVQIKNPLK